MESSQGLPETGPALREERGRIVLVEEDRFRLETEDGRSFLFVLGSGAGRSMDEMESLAGSSRLVEVRYEGQPEAAPVAVEVRVEDRPFRPARVQAMRGAGDQPPVLRPVRKEQASAEIRAILDDIQNTMGIPWSPANWRSYAGYPRVLQLFWERVKPSSATEGFLRESLGIAELAYRDVSSWYLPSSHIQLAEQDRGAVQWELDALEFGNPQLLIQQAALTRMIRGLFAGREGQVRGRSRPSPYRNPEIQVVAEEEAPEPIRQLYQDIKQTLGLPLVNSDYQALAKWPAFLVPAWDDVKRWLPRGEYRRLEHRLSERAEMAAGRLTPPVGLDPAELQAAFGSHEERESVQQLVQMFTQLLPGLIVNDALFRIAATSGQPLPPPTPGA